MPGRSRRADARDGDCTPVATGTGAGHKPRAYGDVGSHNAFIEELCREAQIDSLINTAYRSYAREQLTSWMTERRSADDSRAALARVRHTGRRGKAYSRAHEADHCIAA